MNETQGMRIGVIGCEMSYLDHEVGALGRREMRDVDGNIEGDRILSIRLREFDVEFFKAGARLIPQPLTREIGNHFDKFRRAFVGVNLISGEMHLMRTLLGIGDQVSQHRVDGRHGVAAVAVGSAARALNHFQIAEIGGRQREAGQPVLLIAERQMRMVDIVRADGCIGQQPQVFEPGGAATLRSDLHVIGVETAPLQSTHGSRLPNGNGDVETFTGCQSLMVALIPGRGRLHRNGEPEVSRLADAVIDLQLDVRRDG